MKSGENTDREIFIELSYKNGAERIVHGTLAGEKTSKKRKNHRRYETKSEDKTNTMYVW